MAKKIEDIIPEELMKHITLAGDSKRPKNWLGLKSTGEFMAVLSEGRNLPSSDFVRVTYGNNGSTWMHEDVALEFARWCDMVLD